MQRKWQWNKDGRGDRLKVLHQHWTDLLSGSPGRGSPFMTPCILGSKLSLSTSFCPEVTELATRIMGSGVADRKSGVSGPGLFPKVDAELAETSGSLPAIARTSGGDAKGCSVMSYGFFFPARDGSRIVLDFVVTMLRGDL